MNLGSRHKTLASYWDVISDAEAQLRDNSRFLWNKVKAWAHADEGIFQLTGMTDDFVAVLDG